jgi:hypothetical protein
MLMGFVRNAPGITSPWKPQILDLSYFLKLPAVNGGQAYENKKIATKERKKKTRKKEKM